MKISPSRVLSSWNRVSEYEYVHVSGARIERRGFPHPSGWFLTPAGSGRATQRFEPTPQGCDQAFIAFAGGAIAATRSAAL